MVQKEPVHLLVFEGRGAWAMYRETSSKQIRVDSPLQNIYDATRIAIKLAEKGKRVVMIPVIDKLVPTAIYNKPRTYTGSKEDWREDFSLIVEPRQDIGVSRNYRDRVSHRYEIYNGHKMYIPILFPNNERTLIGKPMSVFDVEATIELITKLLERYLGNRNNITINPIVLPNQEFDSAVIAMLDLAIKRGAVHTGIGEFNKRMLHGSTPGKTVSLPIFFRLTEIGYLNSDLRVEVDRNNQLSLIVPGIYEASHRAESLLELIEHSQFYSAKYPIIILGYVYEILKYLGLSINIREELTKLYNTIFDREKDRMREGRVQKYDIEQYINELLHRTELRESVSAFYFIEGDLGGINPGTGGKVGKIFQIFSQAMGASYYRVISVERELLEPRIKDLSFESFEHAVNSLENESGSLYIEEDGKYIRKKISEVVK